MSKDISAINILEKFAEKTNREFEKFEEIFPSPVFAKFVHSNRWITIKDIKGAYLFGFDNSSNSLQINSLIGGIAIPVNMIQSEFSMILNQKDILDKINIFKKFEKTYDKKFDKDFVIQSSSIKSIPGIFDDPILREHIKKTIFNIPALTLEINNIQLNNISKFKDRSIICLYTNEWIFNEMVIEELFQLTYKIYDQLVKKALCR